MENPTRNPGPGTRHPSGGFTLLELMVVLGIIGIVLGIGAGMFLASREDAALQTGFHDVLSLARFVHAQALVRRVPASLRFDLRDPQSPKVEALIDRTFGLWHAEDLKTTGAYGLDGRASGATLEPGKVGFAFFFKGSGSVRADGLEMPAAADALSVEAWINPVELTGRQIIVEKQGEFTLRLENGGMPTGGFGASAGRLRADRVRIAREQWSHLRLVLEGGVCALELNGRALDAGPFNRMPTPTRAPVVIGQGFHGMIDEVIIRGRVAEESATLDPDLKLTLAGTAEDPDPKFKGKLHRVHYTAEGRLDVRYHSGPVTMTLASPKASHAVKIGWMGTVEK